MTSNQKATALALGVVLMWSTVATAFKIALSGMNFYQLLLIATWVSTFVLALFLITKNEFVISFRLSRKQYLLSMLLGALNPFAYYLILLKAYSLLPAYMAQPLNYTWPVVLVFFSAIFLKQKLTWLSFFALVVSFFGVWLISNGNDTTGTSSTFWGVLLATSSSLVWSAYWVLNLKDQRSPTQKLFINFLFGSIYIFLFCLWAGFPAFKLTTPFIAAIYIGVFEMGITFILWMTALQMATRTDKISIYIFLSPFISLIFITTILGEKITLYAFLGFIFIALGILMSKWREITTFERGKQR